MNEISAQGLFNQQIFKIDLTLTPRELGKNLDDKFLTSLKSRVEGKMLLDKGFIEKGSVEILKRTSGSIEDNTFSGNVVSRVIYQANVCNPAIGSVVSARVQNVNNLGFLAINGPLYIIIPREIHRNLELFTKYSRGDEISIRIIRKEFNFKENMINVVGQLEEDFIGNSNKKITMKRKVNKSKVENSKTEVSEITEIEEGTKTLNNVIDETEMDIDEDEEEEAKNVLEGEDEESEQDQEDFGDAEEEEDESDFELDDGDDYELEEQENEDFE